MDAGTLTGFVIDGASSLDESGSSVSGAGDLNGDGIDDLMIGAPGETGTYGGHAGERYDGDYGGESDAVFVPPGGFDATVDLSVFFGADRLVLEGVRLSDYSVSVAGDVNGDGIDDLIIGSPSADPNESRSGESYVVFGRSGGLDATLELSTLDGAYGFTIEDDSERDFSSFFVSGAGDLNGDGIDDLVVSVPHEAGGDLFVKEGFAKSYLIFGRSGAFDAVLDLSKLDGSDGFVIEDLGGFAKSGFSISGAGDVDGDGNDDLIIETPVSGPNGKDSGERYVIRGGADNLALLDRTSREPGHIDLAKVGTVGTDEADEIDGSDADDRILGLRGADILRGAGGNDTLWGGTGDDILFGSWGDDVLLGNRGDDVLLGNRGDDVLLGNRGDDVLLGNRGDDRLEGGAGSDRLHGKLDDDVIDGGEGDDVLRGNRGADALTGSDGADRFVIRARDGERDVIEDFEDGRDLIDLRRWKIGFEDLTFFDEVPGEVRIEIEGEPLVVRDGGAGLLTASDLTEDGFLF